MVDSCTYWVPIFLNLNELNYNFLKCTVSLIPWKNEVYGRVYEGNIIYVLLGIHMSKSNSLKTAQKCGNDNETCELNTTEDDHTNFASSRLMLPWLRAHLLKIPSSINTKRLLVSVSL